jgi:hypothetical protein
MSSIILPSAGMRRGKAKPDPDTIYLRQFPGKRRFERVSQEDWEAILPHKDIAGFGHILRLEADIRVFNPKGPALFRKWPSRSYIRNFARIMRNTFGQNVQLVDRNAGNQTTILNTASGAGGTGFIPSITQETTSTGAQANPEMSGAGFAIGNGVAAEVHTRNDLVARVGAIISSRNNVRTSVLTTATTTLEITTGITNGQAVSINVSEIGLFGFCSPINVGASSVPFSTLLIYDGIASTPVATGGVIAPRYTMDFPV